MEQLNRDELERLRSWQRRMITVFVGTMLGLVVLVAVDLVVDLSRTAATFAFAALVLLAGVGALIQFTERCPRCRCRLGFQSRLLVPAHCSRCGVALRPEVPE